MLNITSVASANQFDGYYKLQLADLKAVKMEGSDVKYNSSDFANANLLLQKEANSLLNSKVVPIATNSVDARVFPNPVTNSSFNVLFDNKTDGKYSIVLSDLAGRTLLTKSVNIKTGIQTAQVNLNAHMAKGIYVVKVLDENKSIIVNERIVIQ